MLIARACDEKQGLVFDELGTLVDQPSSVGAPPEVRAAQHDAVVEEHHAAPSSRLARVVRG